MEIPTEILNDIQSISNRSNFGKQIKANKLLDLLKQTNQSSSQLSRNGLYKMKNDAIVSAGRHKYVAMKWMMYLHQALQITQSSFVVDMIDQILDSMVLPSPKCKFQKYMLSKFYQPYLQYLKKLAGLKNAHLTKRSASKSPKKDDEESLLFSQFNLMLYVGQQLVHSVCEFKGYFQKFYPCLNNYQSLIGRDMRKLYKKISIAYHNNRLSNLTYLQIETLGSTLEIFTKLDESDMLHSWLMTQTQTRSQEIASSPLGDFIIKEKDQDAGTAVSSTCNL